MDGGLIRSVFTVDSAGNGATRRPSVPIGREDDRWKLVQRWLTRRQQQLLTLDPLRRNVFGLRMPSRCSLAVGRLRMRPMRIGPRNGVKIGTVTGLVTGMVTGMVTGGGLLLRSSRTSGSKMRVGSLCVEPLVQARSSSAMRKRS